MIPQSEILRRRDMRDVFTFTIDPADAKDFDDALSFEMLSDRDDLAADTCQLSTVSFQIGVHIADVSHYVRPNTDIDDEAYRKGTSVYLVDKVIPMLPEELCNDLCSLKPGEDKLCMSVVFTFEVPLKTCSSGSSAESPACRQTLVTDSSTESPADCQTLAPDFGAAKVLKYKICRTVIRSDMRLNYEEAQQIILSQTKAEPLSNTETTRKRDGNETETRRQRDGNGLEGHRRENERIREAIFILNALAQKLRADRIAAGAMTIEQEEMRFRLDDKGYPVEIYFEQPNEAHHLIEEFMLLANRTIARFVGSGRPFVYRVHDLPDEEKLEKLRRFKKRMGTRLPPQALDLLTIRAQAKAVYSTYNIGHYGLAFSHYTHFTSPIRRYPDLMVHRLVEKYILKGKKETMSRAEMEMMCEHCSACEQDAILAERDSIKHFQALWMSSHVGEIMHGYIRGVTDFGLFVQLDGNRCEGLVRISQLAKPGEYWQYDEENYRLVCENVPGTHPFTLGDPITVRIMRVDTEKGQIELELI